jgi:hypothetical protein
MGGESAWRVFSSALQYAECTLVTVGNSCAVKERPGQTSLGACPGVHQTKLFRSGIQAHGSVRLRLVPGDVGHSCPRLLQNKVA